MHATRPHPTNPKALQDAQRIYRPILRKRYEPLQDKGPPLHVLQAQKKLIRSCHQAGMHRYAWRLSLCPVTHKEWNDGKHYPCRQRQCKLCCWRKGNKEWARSKHLVEHASSIISITLDGPIEKGLNPRTLISNFAHIRGLPFWQENVKGGKWSLEAFPNGDTFIWHLHIIAEYTYYTGLLIWDFEEELDTAWKALYKGKVFSQAPLKIEQVSPDDPEEVHRRLRYPHKPPAVEDRPTLVLEYHKITKHLKMTSYFGTWYKAPKLNSKIVVNSKYYTQHPDSTPAPQNATKRAKWAIGWEPLEQELRE